MKHNVLISLTLIALAGCASGPTLNERLAGWQGVDLERLALEIGEPKFVSPSDDGQLAVWHFKNPQPELQPYEYCAGSLRGGRSNVQCDERSAPTGQAQRDSAALSQKCVLRALVKDGTVDTMWADGGCDRFVPLLKARSASVTPIN